jgi:hypothetical protein
MRNTGLLIFLAVFSLCLFKQNTAQAAALIKNPGFEDTLNYWDDLGGAPTQLSNTVFRNGQYSAYKYVDTVAERDYWSQIYQEVLNFKPGQPVYARIYVKTTLSPEATAKAGLMLQFMDNSDNVLGDTLTSRAVGGNTNWRMLELTAQAAPAGTTKARLSGYIWAMQGDNISKLARPIMMMRIWLNNTVLYSSKKVCIMPDLKTGLTTGQKWMVGLLF